MSEFLPPIPGDRTSSTDDERIGEVMPLPPPAHLIRFFPIRGTPAEALVARTRQAVNEHSAPAIRSAAGRHRPLFHS